MAHAAKAAKGTCREGVGIANRLYKAHIEVSLRNEPLVRICCEPPSASGCCFEGDCYWKDPRTNDPGTSRYLFDALKNKLEFKYGYYQQHTVILEGFNLHAMSGQGSQELSGPQARGVGAHEKNTWQVSRWGGVPGSQDLRL